MKRNMFGLFTVVVAIAAAMTIVNVAGAQVVPATCQFLPSVAHASGAQGSQWRTDVWVYNPHSTQNVTVTISLGDRVAFPTLLPLFVEVVVEPKETAAYEDIVLSLFGADNKVGALQFESDLPLAVTSRIYSELSGETTGQFFSAISCEDAIGTGEVFTLSGMGDSEKFRSNFGFAETTGNEVSVLAQRFREGEMVAEKTYAMGAYGVQQMSIQDIGAASASKSSGDADILNDTLTLTVVEGSGKVAAFGSVIDNATNDPSTVMPVVPQVKPGIYQITANRGDYTVAGALTIYVTMVDGVPTRHHLFFNLTADCDGISAAGYGGGLGGKFPIGPDGEYSTSWNGYMPLHDGTGISVYDQVSLQFNPNGRVTGRLTRLLQTGTAPEFTKCYGWYTDYTLTGGWTGPWTPPPTQ